MQYKTLYRVHYLEDVSEDERFGRLEFEPDNTPIIVNSDVPDLYPNHWNMEDYESFLLSLKPGCALPATLHYYELKTVECNLIEP